jgi:hypothetical protein
MEHGHGTWNMENYLETTRGDKIYEQYSSTVGEDYPSPYSKCRSHGTGR